MTRRTLLKAFALTPTAALLLGGCGAGTPAESGAAAGDADALMRGMTLREKAGQLFVIRPDALDPALDTDTINDSKADGVKTASQAMLDTLTEYPVGGFCMFGKNLAGAEQLAALMSGLAGDLATAPLFCVDEEGGRVARLARSELFDVPQYSSMQELAESGEDAVREAGSTIGTYLKKYGFTLDFAPVADVNTNPDNTVIGDRAFGSDPEAAAKMVTACVEGLHGGGVGCTLKHFPGHGDTAEDTHSGYASTQKTWEEMQGCEMITFKAGIAAGADAVMAAHITTPNATDDGLPASLSYTMITERLRGELGFDGLVVTDALAMGAVTEYYTPGEAALLALQAGCDILLMPNDLAEAFDAVVNAVESGEVTEARVDESVKRILEFKKKYGLV